MIPDSARRHLYGYQVICEHLKTPTYADVIWGLRYPGPEPKSTGAWPFQRVTDQTNVTVLRKGKKP